MSDSDRKETLAGPPRPGAVRAGAATVAPTGPRPDAAVPTPIAHLPEAPAGTAVARHSVTVTGPDGTTHTLSAFEPGFTRLPSRAELDAAAADLQKKLRAEQEAKAAQELAATQANAKLQVRRPINWIMVPLVFLGGITWFVFLAWMIARPFLCP